MATTFLEPGGDADFTNPAGNVAFRLWPLSNAGAAVATDFVHGSHLRSIQYITNANSFAQTDTNIISDSGSRISFYLYINALGSASSTFMVAFTAASAIVVRIRLTSAGVLQLFEATSQLGSSGSTLTTGRWYRISLAYTITSTTINRFELFLNGISDISVTNATITNTASTMVRLGNLSANSTFDIRTSDHYIDDSNSLTDTGDIWVTAKRPNANGTTNGFTTQIGSGGSGYGSGHSPQVNERPASTSNGWSMVGAGAAVTEEYNIESRSTGDIDISTATIIDYMGWVSASSGVSETAQIIVNGVNSNISIGAGNNTYKAFASSSTYPAGTGSDIGIITATTLTTVNLYECGIIVAYIPPLKTINGLGREAAKTVNNLAIASVKTWNGLT